MSRVTVSLSPEDRSLLRRIADALAPAPTVAPVEHPTARRLVEDEGEDG